MNILQVNKFYYIRDGISSYFFNLSKLLKRKGHNLSFFSTKNSRNRHSKFSEYFVSYTDFDRNTITEIPGKAARMLYSVEARNKIKALLDSNKVDIVHIHSIFHYISPSILYEFKKRNIPVVMTLHDYHMISPNYLLFHGNRTCEISKPDLFYKAIFHKCVKDSYFSSFAEVTEKYLNKFFLHEKDQIDMFICPSIFVKEKYIEFGFPENKLTVIPHFIDPAEYKPEYKNGKYFLYFGRLAPEKGLKFLLKVMSTLPYINLIIAGEGPESNFIKDYLDKSALKNVETFPYQNTGELKKLIMNAKFTIVPSIWYEGFGMVILEANACGKPVIGARIGGIPEVIKNGKNGFLFMPGNADDCRKAIKRLWIDNRLGTQMGKNSRKIIESDYHPDKHYDQIMQVYKTFV